MNKRAESSDLLQWTVIYVVIFLVFFAGAYFIIDRNFDNAGFWEEFYAKEIARVINFAESGDVVMLDVTRATRIAAKNGKNAGNADEVFKFDEEAGEVIISLRQSGGTGYSYLSDKKIESYRVELVSGEINKDRLILVIK